MINDALSSLKQIVLREKIYLKWLLKKRSIPSNKTREDIHSHYDHEMNFYEMWLDPYNNFILVHTLKLQKIRFEQAHKSIQSTPYTVQIRSLKK